MAVALLMLGCSAADRPSAPSPGSSSSSKDESDASTPGNVQEPLYAVGGSIAGLRGSGLVLQNNGGDDLTVSPLATSFAFAQKLRTGATFKVTIKSQPTNPEQNCSVGAASGEIGSGDVQTILINCSTRSFAIGGTVRGLEGTGLVLQSNPAAEVPVNGNGTFALPIVAEPGSPYAVTVKTQPVSPKQTCTVQNGSGNVVDGPVTTIDVTCVTDTFELGGSISNLKGSGLVLQVNDGDDVSVAANATEFVFPRRIRSGSTYRLTVKASPSNPSQTCVFADRKDVGTIVDSSVRDVVISCSVNTFQIRPRVTGLDGSIGLVLRLNGKLETTVTQLDADGRAAFSEPIESGKTYAVTVKTQPSNPARDCDVTNGTGTVGSADVTDVSVSCRLRSFAVGGSVEGLTNSGLVLQNNGGDDLAVSPGTSFSFATKVQDAGVYSVTIKTQPTGQVCSVTPGTNAGKVFAAPVTTVEVTCGYRVGGSVLGLNSGATPLVLQLNGGGDLALSSDGAFAFDGMMKSGDAYNVTIKASPTAPRQLCDVSGGSGLIGSNGVDTIRVECVNDARIGVVVRGLAGSGLVLRNNGGPELAVAANGEYAFVGNAPKDTLYNVTVKSAPSSPAQTCYVVGGSGKVPGASGATIRVGCISPSTLSAGFLHACAIKANKSVACWGSNSFGQSTAPEGAFSAVAAGGSHSCAIRDPEGSLVCWGADNLGQLQAPSTPGETFVALSAGFYHTCAITSEGFVKCWGAQEFDQPPAAAAVAPAGKRFVAVAAADDHSCGVEVSGEALCWGSSSGGKSTPPAGSFVSVTAGGNHSCAIQESSKITCWGGDLFDSFPKISLEVPDGVCKSLSSGGSKACAVTAAGTVVCWPAVQPVLGGSPDPLLPPEGLGSSAAVSKGVTDFVCALRNDRTAIACWGQSGLDVLTDIPTGPFL